MLVATLVAALGYILLGATEKEVTLFEAQGARGSDKWTCVAVYSENKEASDVIVRVVYRRLVIGISQDQPQPLWLSKTITFPVYPNVASMGDCVDIRLNEVEKIEVRWLQEIK